MSVFEGEAAMNEYTFYRNWVESWLQHIRSYTTFFELMEILLFQSDSRLRYVPTLGSVRLSTNRSFSLAFYGSVWILLALEQFIGNVL